jgi:hypothetical protein
VCRPLEAEDGLIALEEPHSILRALAHCSSNGNLPFDVGLSAADAGSDRDLQGLLRLLCWPGVDFRLDPPEAVSGANSMVLFPVALSIFLFASLWA